MAPVSCPPRPLRILTIDGGGLQAKSTLLILDELLNTIVRTNGLERKPRPCDVFDVIAGIGTGGWLALLLGRFHMDITACMSEWYNIIQSTATNSKVGGLRTRVMKHYAFDPDRLVEHINELTKTYRSGHCLFADDENAVRVFVAALRFDGKGYNLFRSYPVPQSAKMSDKLLEGPESPTKFTISHAFGVTGAARYISSPWKERMARSGMVQHYDTTFPNPHNITELALDEIWSLYGTDVELSAVVNIGPGFSSNHDGKKRTRSFSWGLKLPSRIAPRQKRPTSPAAPDEHLPKKRSPDEKRDKKTLPSSNVLAPRLNESIRREPSCLRLPKLTIQRIGTFGSIKGRKFEEKLQRDESEIESDIQKKLDNVSKLGSELYYRLAPDLASQEATQKEPSAASNTVDTILKYLQLSHVRKTIDEIAQKMSEPPLERKTSRADDAPAAKERSVDGITLIEPSASDISPDCTKGNPQTGPQIDRPRNSQNSPSDAPHHHKRHEPMNSISTASSTSRRDSPLLETTSMTSLSTLQSVECPKLDARDSGTYCRGQENCPALGEETDIFYTPTKPMGRRKTAPHGDSWDSGKLSV